jgi:hypothetical protein
MRKSGERVTTPGASLRVKAEEQIGLVTANWDPAGYQSDSWQCVGASRIRVFPARLLRTLQHADFEPDQESACPEDLEGANLQALHAGGGTRTPDTRIMIPLL